MSRKVLCVLCRRSEETMVTGALSTKDEITAHQNCLLYSSGLCCENSPQFDDLFGFSVEDVTEEVKRGSRLKCSRCKKKGATAGCEVRCCGKSFHYPCAIEEGATTVDDSEKGSYVLYCQNHYQKLPGRENGSFANVASSKASSSGPAPDKARPSKNGEEEGDVSHDGLSTTISILCCDKYAPLSRERNSHATGASVFSGDSSSSSSTTHTATKRRFSLIDRLDGREEEEEELEIPPNRQSKKTIISDDSSDQEENNSNLAIFGPLESDIDENTDSVPEQQAVDCKNMFESEGTVERQRLLSNVHSSPRSPSPVFGSTSTCTQTAWRRVPETPVKVEMMVLTEESALSPSPVPVGPPDQPTTGPSDSAPVPDHSTDPSVTDPPQCTTSCVAICSASSQTAAPTNSEPLDSSRFWKSCNAAGVTEAIFKDFINTVNDISRRIQSDVASQEDYDVALSVIQTSGKLTEFVTKQQEELKRKEREVLNAAAAMTDVVASLTAATNGT
ncbi:uncharacterized protein phf11 isoform X2 [Cynoglossus semilaevis]|uniref:uncharacterized protein phf11 isoform X2 n=1 Tax=Cynoglossus semilaevis TaxID=244447 RepID=UPI000D6258EF|nr:uncharacterized protein LOC103391772 isoform X2 [Cynoglossus semilaevis]